MHSMMYVIGHIIDKHFYFFYCVLYKFIITDLYMIYVSDYIVMICDLFL